MRLASHSAVLATLLAGSCGVACAATIAQGPVGAGSSGTETVGPATIVTTGTGTGSTAPSGPPRGTPAEQTHPRMLPPTGRARTQFTIRLTLADAPGHTGVVATDYRLQLTTPTNAHVERCSPGTAPGNIQSGSASEVLGIRLITPVAGWCTGRYRLTVFLQRGPYCPPPAAGQPPAPCPEFATQELDVGDTHFTITAPGQRHRHPS